METALLQSCFSLPKLAFILRCCPPALILNALKSFDGWMYEALSDLVGSPLSDWAWLKASLPSSSGGLNVRCATLHAPAAYIGSFSQAQPLVSDILGHLAKHPPLLPMALASLQQATARPDWVLLQDIDVPLTQHCLWPSPLPLCMLATGSMLSPLQPSASACRIESSVSASSIG